MLPNLPNWSDLAEHNIRFEISWPRKKGRKEGPPAKEIAKELSARSNFVGNIHRSDSAPSDPRQQISFPKLLGLKLNLTRARLMMRYLHEHHGVQSTLTVNGLTVSQLLEKVAERVDQLEETVREATRDLKRTRTLLGHREIGRIRINLEKASGERISFN